MSFICPDRECDRQYGHPGQHQRFSLDPNQPAVLLRDTPEDRDRLADKVHGLMKEWGDADVRTVNGEEFADDLIAALRGEIGVEAPSEGSE